MKKHRIDMVEFSGTWDVPIMPGQRTQKKTNIRERIYNWVFRSEERHQSASSEPQRMEVSLYDEAALGSKQHAEIQQALLNWKASAAYFESVTDPELVDYAVFDMETAQKRYVYLLRSMRADSTHRDITMR